MNSKSHHEKIHKRKRERMNHPLGGNNGTLTNRGSLIRTPGIQNVCAPADARKGTTFFMNNFKSFLITIESWN
jgi:hypothetical protein